MRLTNSYYPKMKESAAINARISAKLDDIDWSFFREIPITEVAEIYGIELDNKGTFCCPAHLAQLGKEDEHASAGVYGDNDTKWKCHSCGAGGSALDFVMAVEDCERLEAVISLNEYFPGGVTYKTEKAEEGELIPPEIDVKILKAAGIKKNLYNQVGKSPEITYQAVTEIIIDRLIEYQNSLKEYGKQIFGDFPQLENSAAAKAIIWGEINNQIAMVEVPIIMYRDFLVKVIEQESDKSFVEEIEDNER